MSVNVDLAQHGLSEALGLFASLDIKNRRGSIWTSHDWSMLGLGCSRFMIHESGSMFGFARVGNQINHSLLYATASAIRSSTHPRR